MCSQKRTEGKGLVGSLDIVQACFIGQPQHHLCNVGSKKLISFAVLTKETKVRPLPLPHRPPLRSSGNLKVGVGGIIACEKSDNLETKEGSNEK